MIDANVGAKLLLSYDVPAESLHTYFRFFLGRYLPIMQSMGFEVSEAWQTAYGNFPNRLVGFITPDQERMLALPENDKWLKLNDELEELVINFSYKVIPYHEGFQL